METGRGVYYIAINDGIYDHLSKSIKSVKGKTNLPVAIATDNRRKAEEVGADIVIDIPSKVPGLEGRPAYPDQGYFSKVYWMKETPFERTIFLDHDTYALSDISSALDMLDRFDVCAAPEVGRQSSFSIKVPNPVTLYNTGVLVYKKDEKTGNFLKLWWELLRELNDPWGDQPCFLDALWKSPDISFGTMLREWNFRFIFPQSTYGEVVILHGRAEDLAGIGRRLNDRAYDTGRLWYSDRLIARYEPTVGFIEV